MLDPDTLSTLIINSVKILFRVGRTTLKADFGQGTTPYGLLLNVLKFYNGIILTQN
jgi:hypothetical protein